MSDKDKRPSVPSQRFDTVRHEITQAITDVCLSAKEISADVGVAEKEVYPHLERIKKTLHTEGHTLRITPAECKKCGFVFTKRTRFTKPGKCPICRGTSIEAPLFCIEG